ncbi:MAG: type 1 glutamine amidotransferase [Chitinispirillaceae bacterium]
MHRIHFIQNISFETPGYLKEAAAKLGFQTCTTDLSHQRTIPDTQSFDALVVLGGPMNIYEVSKYPWLNPERNLIEQSLRFGKKILGICLGAQLVADVMGAAVQKNRYKEIGWHKVELDPDAAKHRLFHGFPSRFTTFHWHGDTFSVPRGAHRIGSSEACLNQGFVYGDQIVALQFHPEITKETIENLLGKCADELVESPFIQKPSVIRSEAQKHIESNHRLIDNLLGKLLGNKPEAERHDF